MRMPKKCFLPVVLAVLACGTATARTPTRVLTVDDTLRVQNVGQAVFANDERTLVYEWVVAHEDAPNLDVLLEQGDPGPHSKLYAVSPQRPEAPRLLFPQEDRGGYWIGALSPDGRRLAVYSLVSHTLRAGVFEFESGRLTWFDFTPNYSSFYMQHPTWISNDELVYVAMGPGARPSVLGQYAMAEGMREAWEKTFAGKEPSVTVLTSPVSGVEDPDPFEKGTLLRVDAHTGRTAALDKGYFSSLTLSPDGRYLAALRFGGQLRATNRGFTGFGRKLTPFVFDLKAGARKLSPCDDCHVLFSNLWWSADSQRLAFRSFHVSDETLGIHQYEPAAQALRTLDEKGLWLSCWAPVIPVGSGHDLAVFAQPLQDRNQTRPWIPTCTREARQDWYLKGDADELNMTASIHRVGETPAALTPEGLLILTADGEAWILGGRGSTRRLQVARGVDSGLGLWQPWSMSAIRSGAPFATDHVVLQTPRDVIYYNLGAMRGSGVPRPSAEASLLAMSPRYALFREDGKDGSSRLRLTGGGATRDLLAFNTHLRGIRLGSQVHVPFEFEGSKLSTCLLLPPDATAQQRYPTIVYVYPGGPLEASCYSTGVDFYSAQLFAAKGYAVLFAPAPSKLIRTPDGPTRQLPNIALAAVDAAIARGYTDADRLGVYGMSQGFHSALQVITETRRFKAAVAANGIADFVTHYGSGGFAMGLTRPFGGSGPFNAFSNADRYEQPGDDNGLGVAPWVDPGRYTSNSPVFQADRIETPVLLLYGDFDAFGMSQAMEMFSVLYRLRKETQYAIYWGEAHGNIAPANVRDVWKRMLDWYGQHLGVGGQSSANQTPGK